MLPESWCPDIRAKSFVGGIPTQSYTLSDPVGVNEKNQTTRFLNTKMQSGGSTPRQTRRHRLAAAWCQVQSNNCVAIVFNVQMSGFNSIGNRVDFGAIGNRGTNNARRLGRLGFPIGRSRSSVRVGRRLHGRHELPDMSRLGVRLVGVQKSLRREACAAFPQAVYLRAVLAREYRLLRHVGVSRHRTLFLMVGPSCLRFSCGKPKLGIVRVVHIVEV